MSNLQIPPYVLPDGTRINYFDELCTVPELLFLKPTENRSMLDMPSFAATDKHYKVSLPKLVYDSLSRCDIDVRKDLCSSILVVGGGSLIDGLGTRISEELSEALPANYKPKVASPLPIERHYAPWIGGSILSICGSFQQMWVSKSEYEEHGSSVVVRKFVMEA
jgi:actin-like protein 6A